MISPIKVIGSLVYRTRESLRKDKKFLSGLKGYTYANSLISDNINLWYYPGTHQEIKNVLLTLDKHKEGKKSKFPGLFNFMAVKQTIAGLNRSMVFNLAFVAPVNSEWTTEQREAEVFERVLRPIYQEFINQVIKSGYFKIGYGTPSHTYYEVYTTGNNGGELIKQYGDHIDAIELHNLQLILKDCYTPEIIEKIEKDNQLLNN